ncbi:Histidine-binding periplasmic protein [Paraburkholderia caffeinitolerans]|uniref:Histidine-binding periplasmic protein n=1 Tax=Paraburkholderia caffeinitolerans TaxID=1723730 RepID=A0A6J5GNK3_9BURK|nr:transporter substrate-binding domain-containing protein [Paraburkholderia caffeinitolerans]CAB3803614.1 Histidine-binding periplasmic protein [Paraburkholderia caffeinitolerans]
MFATQLDPIYALFIELVSNYRDTSGELKGFEIDIAREIGRRMNANVQFVCLGFDGLIPALLSNKIDIITSSLSITEARKKSIDFSIPYRISTARFVGRKGAGLHPMNADNTPNASSLKGKVVGVQRATTNDNYLAGEFPGVEIARYDTSENMLLDLVDGRIDLALVSPMKVRTDFLDKPEGRDFEFVSPEIEAPRYLGDGVAVGLPKGETARRDEINAALRGMFADGTFKAINQKYWAFSVLPAVWH